MPPRRPALAMCLGLAAVCTSACTSTRQSNTARTATEQLLIANSIDQSLDKVDFTPLSNASVFVEEKYLDCVDKGYLISSVRHRLLRHGAALVTKPEEAEVILEVRAGAVGTDLSSSFMGMPEITLPGMLSIPEVKLISRDAQKAAAKIGLVAYDAKTKRLLGEGGVSSSFADYTNTFVFGMGPVQHGTLKSEIDTTIVPLPGQTVDPLPAQVAFHSPTPGRHAPEEADVQLSGGDHKSEAGESQVEKASGKR